MASGWQNKLVRLSQMDWNEVRTRAAQEVHKRLDFVLYRMGGQPALVRLMASPSRQGRFFFAASEVAERAHALSKNLPDETDEILREADEVCLHRFRLLGYQDLDYGPEIDWHRDLVHGKRAPLDPWFKIPFLDFATVGDHKVTWELNRHQHLVTLAKAWLLSKDQKYVGELIAQWRSWTQANPYPIGINWGSTLEVAFRSLSWIWVDHLLAEAPGHAEYRSDLVQGLAFHGRYIERYLSTYFSPNTHLLGEAVALFFIGTLYPQIPAATRWQQTGWKVLLQEAQRQVRSDGVYFEQSLYYHVYALDFFLHARLLAARNGSQIPASFDDVLARMLNVVQALSQAGPPEGFGDDDGGRVFNPRRNRTEHMTDPLALGAMLYGRDHFPAARLTEESIWLFGQQAASLLAQPSDRASLQASAFPDGGIYLLAESQPYPQAMVVDAGPQGVGRCGHGHADALSLRLTMDGRRWLVDAGSGIYISSDPADRNVFRGTGTHNTLRVDAMDQAIPSDPFSWNAIPATRSENWIVGKTFTYFAGSHDGYSRLADPVIHRRYVLKINGGPWLVRDVVLGKEEHDLEIFWHFASDLEPRTLGAGVLVTPKSGMRNSTGQPAVRLLVPQDVAWRLDISKGLVSPAYGVFEPAPIARCHGRQRLPAELATILMPHDRIPGEDVNPALASVFLPGVHMYELVDEDENHAFCFALDKRAWTSGPWSSDAELLYCGIRGERLVHLVVIGGSYVAWQGEQLLKAEKPCSCLEWRKQDGMIHADPDVFSFSALFQELTGASSSSSDTTRNTSSRFAEKN